MTMKILMVMGKILTVMMVIVMVTVMVSHLWVKDNSHWAGLQVRSAWVLSSS